jgi:hypothetical protein
MSRAKDIGTGFEYDVVDMGNDLFEGTPLKATRIWYSGAGLQKPYDVEITKSTDIVMTIEAKRSMGKSIAFKISWLDRITDVNGSESHIIAFACGNFRGKKSLPAYAIYFDPVAVVGDQHCVVARPGKKSVTVNGKYVTVPGAELCIKVRDKVYQVRDLKQLLERKRGAWMS